MSSYISMHPDKVLFGGKKRKKPFADLLPQERLKKKKKSTNSASKFKPHEILLANLDVGLQMLGIIKEINEYDMKIGLPYHKTGVINISNISKAYSEMLKSYVENQYKARTPLRKMFFIGQLITTEVISIELNQHNQPIINLTVDPTMINKYLHAKQLSKDCFLQCAVHKELENGYEMDTGIGTMRSAFLPHNFIDESKQDAIMVGSVVSCAIHNIELDSSEVGIVKLSCLDSSIRDTMAGNQEHHLLATLVPGRTVQVQVSAVNVPYNSLKVYAGEFVGHITREYLKEAFDKICNYGKGDQETAKILYIEPETNALHLTINETIVDNLVVPLPDTHYSRGNKISDACLFNAIRGYKVLRLANGYIAAHRLKLKEEDKAVKEMQNKLKKEKISKEYEEEKEMEVRNCSCLVLTYFPLEQFYLVNTDKKAINMASSVDSFHPSEKVTCVVQSHTCKGLVVQVNRLVKGFIPWSLLSKKKITNPTVQYKLNRNLTAYVAVTDKVRNKLILTTMVDLALRRMKEERKVLFDDNSTENRIGANKLKSPKAFEKILKSQHEDVKTWIQYMEYYAEKRNLRKVETIFSRALTQTGGSKRLHYITLWCKRLEIELTLGDEQSLQTAFEQAKTNCPANMNCELHSKMSQLRNKHGLYQESDELHRYLSKTYSGSHLIWVVRAQNLMDRGEEEEARGLLNAIKGKLSPTEVINYQRKLADFEIEKGDPEKGFELLRDIVSKKCARVDVWAQYIEHLIKLGLHKSAISEMKNSLTAIDLSKPKSFLTKRYKKLLTSIKDSKEARHLLIELNTDVAQPVEEEFI